MLATTATWAAGTLTINMPNNLDNGTLTLVGTEYKVNGASVATAPGGTLEAAEFQRLVATGGGGLQVLTLDAGALALVNGVNVDGAVDIADVKGAIAAGADIDIFSVVTTLENDLGTSGANITITGPVSLVGGARIIQTNGNAGANAGNVFLSTVTSATAGQSLFIEARAATGFSGGTIRFTDIGNNATPLTSFEAHTNGTNGNIDFTNGNVIQTDGGAVVLETPTLDLAGPDDLIDTELGGDNAGGAVDLGAAALIRYNGATLPHLLTIDTNGATGQAAGAVTLPTSNQFVASTPTAGFNNYTDSINARVLIRVATITNFTEDFTSPTAFNRFASNFFTQTGTSFVAEPTKNQKAIAIIQPAQITPAVNNNFTVSTTATIQPKTTAQPYSNAYIVFDAVDPKNFKFAGAFVGRQQFSVGEVKNGKVVHKNTTPITAGNTFNLSVAINASTGKATLSNNGAAVASYTFSPAITTTNGIGVGTNKSKTAFTNIKVIS